MLRVLVLALFVAAAPNPGRLDVETDRFTGELVIRRTAPLAELGQRQTFGFSYRYSKDRPEDGSLALTFERRLADWQLIGCEDIAILADGEPVSVREALTTGQVEEHGVVEMSGATVRFQGLQQMATARYVHARICTLEVALDEDEKASLRRALALLQR